MPLKIIRNDITRMKTEAIVNTASSSVKVGPGCDSAIYKAAGEDKLLEYRKRYIGEVPEGKAFITPSFDLHTNCIIHAVSPAYHDGNHGEEEKLRDCYRNCLKLAKEYKVRSIAFPLIATGSFGYPKEDGIRIAADEINAFLLKNDMEIYLVVFDTRATALGEKLYPGLEAYIDHNYVTKARLREYGDPYFGSVRVDSKGYDAYRMNFKAMERRLSRNTPEAEMNAEPKMNAESASAKCFSFEDSYDFDEARESRLKERMQHISDSFSEYLLYLIKSKGMDNSEVWHRGIVDKKVFSKIKNNSDYHPKKLTAMCLCIGARLNMDEAKDLLARAGYALSPSDKTDVIFSFFIENEIYDMIELDIQLEEYGLPAIIS